MRRSFQMFGEDRDSFCHLHSQYLDDVRSLQATSFCCFKPKHSSKALIKHESTIPAARHFPRLFLFLTTFGILNIIVGVAGPKSAWHIERWPPMPTMPTKSFSKPSPGGKPNGNMVSISHPAKFGSKHRSGASNHSKSPIWKPRSL